MSSGVSINSLVTKVRTRGDVVGSAAFDDTVELKAWVRDSLVQLHELLIQRFKDFYVTSVVYSLSAGLDCYSLPQNFRLLQDCYLFSRLGATRAKLKACNSEELTGAGQFGSFAPLQYRVMRNSIYFVPTPAVDVHNAVLVTYSPAFRSPFLDWTNIDDNMPSGWDEWVVLDVLQKMTTKVRLLNMDDVLKSKMMLEQRILQGSVHRDSEPLVMKARGNYGVAALPVAQGAGPTYWTDA